MRASRMNAAFGCNILQSLPLMSQSLRLGDARIRFFRFCSRWHAIAFVEGQACFSLPESAFGIAATMRSPSFGKQAQLVLFVSPI